MSSNYYKTLCRACLGSSDKLYELRNTSLQGIFEKLTGRELIPGDGRIAVCYICCARLRSSAQFQDMVRQSDEKIIQFLAKNVKIDNMHMPLCGSFLCTPMHTMSLPELVQSEMADVRQVKEEPTELKQEMDFDVEEFTTEADFITLPNKVQPTSERSESPNIYLCNICLKELNSMQELQTHEKSHDQETCRICGENYPHGKTDNHMRKHTKPFKCDVCGKSFSEQSSLTKHLASHSDKKSYFCELCDKGFTHKTYLRNHLRTHSTTHSKEKPFPCQLCGKSFAQIGYLKIHKKTHEKKSNSSKPRHYCKLCSKSYTLGTSLNKHMRNHAGIKPFKCDVCGRCFSMNDTLKSHMRTHTGERPYECECGKRFSTRGNYRKHEKTHLNNND